MVAVNKFFPKKAELAEMIRELVLEKRFNKVLIDLSYFGEEDERVLVKAWGRRKKLGEEYEQVR